jgi:hypothetical protein
MMQVENSKTKAPHGYLWNVVAMKCPRCRIGKLFKYNTRISTSKNNEMHQRCPVCGQPTEIEVGFYYGTGYVSYALTVGFSAATFVAWVLLIGISTEDSRIFWWLGLNAVSLVLLQPWIMRLSRSLWLSWFVKYDNNWKNNKVFNEERIVADQMEGNQDISKATIEKK